MITDYILETDRKKRKYKPNRVPIIRQYREDPSSLDPELKRLRHIMLRPTPDNNEYCFWISSIAQSFSYMTAASIVGDGLRIRCSNGEARRIIEGFNDEINVDGDSIEDYFVSSWFDEITHAKSAYRIEEMKDLAYKLDIQRLDPKTYYILKDEAYGWSKLIQQVGRYKVYRSKASFYANAGKNDHYTAPIYPKKNLEIHIPCEPNVVLRTKFFQRPPIASVRQYIAYKRFILYFMRKYSQKLWTPFILFLIGDTKSNYYPDTPQQMQEAIDDMAEVIPEMVNFGGAAIPGNIVPHELGKNSAKNSEVFVTYMEALDKQTMLGIFGSMGLREASGNELATQRGLREGFNQFIKGIRRRYQIAFGNFYSKALLPAHGIKLTPRDIDIEFSPLRDEESETIMKAVEIGVNTGMFKDRNEIRKAGQQIWTWLEALDETENKKLNFDSMVNDTASRIQSYNSGNLK